MSSLTPQQSHSAQNPTTAPTNPLTHSPPSPPMGVYPPLPRQHSQPDPPRNNAYHQPQKSPQYSPNYPPQHSNQYGNNNNNVNNINNNQQQIQKPSKTPVHLPSQHTNHLSGSHSNLRMLLNPAHSGHSSHHQSGHNSHRHASFGHSRSAPSSPRGMSGNHHHYPSQQSRHMPPPLREEYPEDAEIMKLPIPFGNNGFPPEHMIKSTPTTPNASQSRHHSYHGYNHHTHQHQQQQQQQSSPQRYHPQSQQFNAHQIFQKISEAHSDHEYDYQQAPTHGGNNNGASSYKPTLAPPSHSHHTNNTGHNFQLGSRNNNHAPSGSGPVQYSQTPDVGSSAFNFSSAYGAAANGQGYGGGSSSHLGGGGGHQHMPQTQPTTPVFGAHHSSQSYSSTHHGMGASPHHSHHNHSLYPHHSHHHPMTASAKYSQTPDVGKSSNNTLHPYQSILPQQQHSGPTSMHPSSSHTPSNTLFDNIETELTSPLFCENLTEEIVSEVFNDLQLNH